MDWQEIAVWITAAAVAVWVVRNIVRRLRRRKAEGSESCCGCNTPDCPNRRNDSNSHRQCS